MIDKDGELYKLGFYFSAALLASIIKFLQSKERSWKNLSLELLLGASFAFFLIPAVVEHFSLSVYIGTGLTWLSTIFSKELLLIAKDKLINKIKDTKI